MRGRSRREKHFSGSILTSEFVFREVWLLSQSISLGTHYMRTGVGENQSFLSTNKARGDYAASQLVPRKQKPPSLLPQSAWVTTILPSSCAPRFRWCGDNSYSQFPFQMGILFQPSLLPQFLQLPSPFNSPLITDYRLHHQVIFLPVGSYFHNVNVTSTHCPTTPRRRNTQCPHFLWPSSDSHRKRKTSCESPVPAPLERWFLWERYLPLSLK